MIALALWLVSFYVVFILTPSFIVGFIQGFTRARRGRAPLSDEHYRQLGVKI